MLFTQCSAQCLASSSGVVLPTWPVWETWHWGETGGVSLGILGAGEGWEEKERAIEEKGGEEVIHEEDLASSEAPQPSWARQASSQDPGQAQAAGISKAPGGSFWGHCLPSGVTHSVPHCLWNEEVSE